MEAQTALVWTDSAVELYAVSYVDMYFALVVNPWNTERNDALRLYKTFYELCFLKFWMLVVNVLYRKEDFPYGLQVL